MDYKEIRALVGSWLAGETTLVEEEALRRFFVGERFSAEGSMTLPADLEPLRLMFLQNASEAGLHPERRVVLHTERLSHVERSPRRWIVTVAAAAALTGIGIFVGPGAGVDRGGIVCVVDGVRITDPRQIEQYTREAIGIVNDNLERTSLAVASRLGSPPAMARIGEMIDQLTKTEIE
jgi:hypothetical protein